MLDFDARDAGELEGQVAARDQRIADLEALVAKLIARIEALEAENRELKARLSQNSTNSSKPPSTDPPGTDRQTKPSTGRKPGGQLGHKPHKRELVPPEQVDEFVELVPGECRKCKQPLVGRDDAPLLHQVTEIPPIIPHITEYRRHALTCGKCGTRNRAELPAEVRSAFGDRLAAMACLLVGKYRLSKRLVQDALADLLGVDLALGSVSNLEGEMSAGLCAPMVEAEAFVQQEEFANLDETGWWEGKEDGRAKRAWLWVMATALVTVFRISGSRGGEVAKNLLGNFAGFLGTDRWCAYNWYQTGLRQLCWSHLTRDFQSFIDRGGEGAKIGCALMRQRNRMFQWWHRVRDGTLSQDNFEAQMQKVMRRVGRLLREAVARAEARTAGMAAEILKLEPAMWTFVQVEGLEPTNNFAEQTIRQAVMYRKTCFGTQSPEGSRFVERILTAVTTLKLQRRNVLDFLTATLHAHRRRLPPPSLLPLLELPPQLAIAA